MPPAEPPREEPPLIHWEHRPERLRAPAIVGAFDGWNDAANAAMSTVERLVELLDAKRIAHIDDGRFFDFRSARPHMRSLDEYHREVRWPEIVAYAAHVPDAPRDLILLAGPEPSMCWRTFAATVLELAASLEVELAVTLGAMLADVPHTRPVMVTGMMSDEALAERVGITPTTYEGSTGITGVLHTAFAAAGIPAASIWAAVPHYVSGVVNPCASLSLMRKAGRALGVSLDLERVSADAAAFRDGVDRTVANDPDMRVMVERLEQNVDRADNPLSSPDDDIPDADTLATEFQRYLRRQEEDGREDDDGDDDGDDGHRVNGVS